MRLNKLEKGYADYCAVIEKYAKEQFDTIVKPYLVENGFTFISGAGWGWCIFGKDDKRIPEENLPANVVFALDFNIPGLYNTTLGDWMPTFPEEEL
jgi:hypothetical protein